MFKCPIDYFQDNIIFNADRSCWAAFRLSGYDYDFLSAEGKIEILQRITRLFVGVLSEVQILIVPTEHNTKEHFNRLKKRVKVEDPLYLTAIHQAEETEKYLRQTVKLSGATNDYRTYFLIKLEQSSEYEFIEKWKDLFSYFVKDPVNAVNVFMELDTKGLMESKIKAFRKIADSWLSSNRHKLNMENAETQEIQWLFRRMAHRGTNRTVKMFYEDSQRSDWMPKSDIVELKKEKIIKPLGRDIVNLFQGTIKRGNRYIEIQTDEGSSYQSFFTIINVPETADFPGREWIYLLQQWNAQAEVCIHFSLLDYREGLKKLDIKKREINSQIEHIDNARAKVPDDLLDAQFFANEMENEIKDSRSPLLQTSIAICVSADDQEVLERKCSVIREAYENMDFIIERPLADQVKLFFQFIPSVGSTIKDFIMPITPRTLASGIIGATHELGDHAGSYIGTTGKEKKPVFLDMGQASLKNESPAATFYGNLGVGKSFNANLLLYLNILYGGYGVIFDPKGERSHWEKDLKALNGLISTVTLGTAERDRGKLDPYKVYKEDLNEANELAVNVMSELLKIAPTSREYLAMLEATRLINEGDTPPSMMKLVEILENWDRDDDLFKDAKMMARMIRSQRENGMARLLIGDGTGESITLDNRLNIIQIQNLKMPSQEAKAEEYTIEETLSVVIMMVLSQFAKKFALVKRPVFKNILFDESWMLGKTKEGKKLYEFLSRMGRSLFTGVIYNGHSVTDLPSEGIRNSITYKFCFKVTDTEEAKRMLEYLDLEITPENIEVLKTLRNGECLFQDLEKRVGKLKFDAVFQDIIDVFSTTPTTDEETEKEEDRQETEADQELEPKETTIPERFNFVINPEDIDIYEVEEV